MATVHSFRVSVEVDPRTGELLAAYLKVRRGKVARTREVHAGAVFADYDAKGQLVGVEILAPCPIEVFERIAPDEPSAQEFIKRSVPHDMVA